MNHMCDFGPGLTFKDYATQKSLDNTDLNSGVAE